MKTLLTSVLTATFLGLASLASGRPFDAADFMSILFSTGLMAWTVSQYTRESRTLQLDRPIRLPAPVRPQVVVAPARRLAA